MMSMQAGNPKPIKKPTCIKCRAVISVGARTVIGGHWYCPKCTYEHDYPDKEIQPVRRMRAQPLQKETLFPLPPQRRDG